MELKERIIRNLEWANKRLKLQGKELDETQLEIIEFCFLHDLQQLNIPDVINFVLLSKANYKSKDGTIKRGIEIDGKYYAPKNDC
jgi:hypothetical protein